MLQIFSLANILFAAFCFLTFIFLLFYFIWLFIFILQQVFYFLLTLKLKLCAGTFQCCLPSKVFCVFFRWNLHLCNFEIVGSLFCFFRLFFILTLFYYFARMSYGYCNFVTKHWKFYLVMLIYSLIEISVHAGTLRHLCNFSKFQTYVVRFGFKEKPNKPRLII